MRSLPVTLLQHCVNGSDISGSDLTVLASSPAGWVREPRGRAQGEGAKRKADTGFPVAGFSTEGRSVAGNVFRPHAQWCKYPCAAAQVIKSVRRAREPYATAQQFSFRGRDHCVGVENHGRGVLFSVPVMLTSSKRTFSHGCIFRQIAWARRVLVNSVG